MNVLDRVKKMNPLDRLVYWMTERESIRLKRERGEPAPWTSDPILQKYKFTNVRRMDDKVSRWLYDHWYKPYRDHPNTLAAVVLARHFNVPELLRNIQADIYHGPPGQRVGTKYDTSKPPAWDDIKRRVRAIKADGYRVFSAAYMVRGIGTIDKTEMVVDRVARPLFEWSNAQQIVDPDSMQNTHETLCRFWGMGSFMAGQICADLRWALSGTWIDKHSWAPIGPGSKRGMNILHGREIEHPLHQPQFLDELRDLVDNGLLPRLPQETTKRLEMMDYQNCLCELSGYEKVLWGRGRKKQLYRGGGAC